MRNCYLVLSGLVLLLAAEAWAQPSLVGDRFLISSHTTGQQNTPAICGTPNGGFVVAWTDEYVSYPQTEGRDGSGHGAFARRFGPNADPLEAEFQINTYTPGSQEAIALQCLGGGEFVVANRNTSFYRSPSGFVGREALFGHAFDSNGARVGGEFRIDDGPQSTYLVPLRSTICPTSGGSEFLVVWSHSTSGDHFAKRYDAAGQVLEARFSFGGSETYGVTDCCGTDDGFVVVWEDHTDADGTDSARVNGQLLADDGSPAGPVFQVNTYTSFRQARPDLSCRPDGSFVVVWNSGFGSYSYYGNGVNGQDGEGYGVFGQRFTAAAAPDGTEFQINTTTGRSEQNPSVAHDASGEFLVTWDAVAFEDSDVVGQAFNASGTALGTEFIINVGQPNQDVQDLSALTALGNRNFVVAWRTYDAGIRNYDIEGQRVRLSPGGPTTTSTTTTMGGGGGGVCGDPVDPPSSNIVPSVVAASDALFVLKAAVGTETCALCVCDVNDSGSATASDALLVLLHAVGGGSGLNCPACN